MRKVELNMKENYQYKTIKKVVETNGNKKAASLKLKCTERHINRLINNYNHNGKETFLHGNKGKVPTLKIPDDTRNKIIDLYLNKYYGANFTHFTELLKEHDDINISSSSISSILYSENILSPKSRKSTIRQMKKILKMKQNQPTTSKKEKNIIADKIVSLDNAHPRRPRCAYFGEMIQMDASVHLWFGEQATHLHIAIDDSTGNIVGGYFDTQETLKGYYNVFYQILSDYGIPHMFLTDRRTVFEYVKKNTPSVESDTFTQFGYACHQLGVELNTSSVPQAKGRVERLFQTLQSRLPIELQLAGINTIEQANEFLNSYIKKFNNQFALLVNHNKSVFEIQPNDKKINLILSVLSDRKIDAGHCIRFFNNYYIPINRNSKPIYYRKGTNALIIKTFQGELFVTIQDKVYALEIIPAHEAKSKNFDIVDIPSKPKTKYIPPMDHPWRQSSFKSFISNQDHRKNLTA